jgi:SET domain-containing protein
MEFRDSVIESIKEHSYTKLNASTVCRGVGVFAIRFIPIGTQLFSDLVVDTHFIKWDELNGVGESVISYLSSICNSDESGFYLSRTINNINISYYVNHSDTPNVYHNLDTDTFITLRDIYIGEELLCKYKKNEKDW